MKNLIKKLEEQIAFLQHEISQMSDELYSQQKEVTVLKKQILFMLIGLRAKHPLKHW